MVRQLKYYQAVMKNNIDTSEFMMAKMTMYGYYAITFPMRAVDISLNKEYWSDEQVQEELWSLILESDDQLTWEEGNYFHYLTSPRLYSW
jgi:hypothetical protein